MPTAKELRNEARNLGVSHWEEMTKAELAAAIEEESKYASIDGAKKARKKKTPKPKNGRVTRKKPVTRKKKAKKVVAKKKPSPNPYRRHTNMWWMTEALMVGGTRIKLAKKILPKLHLRFDTESYDDLGYVDRYLVVTAKELEKRGWRVTRQGRGAEQVVLAKPPKKR